MCSVPANAMKGRRQQPFCQPTVSVWRQSRGSEEEGGADVGAEYQLDMMRCLREVNADNNTVGWCAPAVLHCSHWRRWAATLVWWRLSL